MVWNNSSLSATLALREALPDRLLVDVVAGHGDLRPELVHGPRGGALVIDVPK